MYTHTHARTHVYTHTYTHTHTHTHTRTHARMHTRTLSDFHLRISHTTQEEQKPSRVQELNLQNVASADLPSVVCVDALRLTRLTNQLPLFATKQKRAPEAADLELPRFAHKFMPAQKLQVQSWQTPLASTCASLSSSSSATDEGSDQQQVKAHQDTGTNAAYASDEGGIPILQGQLAQAWDEARQGPSSLVGAGDDTGSKPTMLASFPTTKHVREQARWEELGCRSLGAAPSVKGDSPRGVRGRKVWDIPKSELDAGSDGATSTPSADENEHATSERSVLPSMPSMAGAEN